MKKISILICAFIFSGLFLQSAKADPTYAVLDANGNVTNIIVCGSACASGEFGGNKVVLQVAADPVTGENRGGFWQGPGTTTYDSNSGTFTMSNPTVINRSLVEQDGEINTTSSSTISGVAITQFTYNDTIGENLFTRNNFFYTYSDDTTATVSVNKNNTTESLYFNNRKTVYDIEQSTNNSNLELLKSKVDVLISLLSDWKK